MDRLSGDRTCAGDRPTTWVFRLLGPLEVVRDSVSVPLGPGKQRTLLTGFGSRCVRRGFCRRIGRFEVSKQLGFTATTNAFWGLDDVAVTESALLRASGRMADGDHPTCVQWE